jgi:pyrroline-5-carboxylate reductase
MASHQSMLLVQLLIYSVNEPFTQSTHSLDLRSPWTMKSQKTISLGFLGGGQMATALASGALQSQLITADCISFFDPSPEAQARLKEQFPGTTIVMHAKELFQKCETIVLAVKPQVLLKIGSEIAESINAKHLLVSVVAGVTLTKLEAMLGSNRVIRVMPNTPCQLRVGASGVAAAKGASPEDRQWVENLMSSVGMVQHVDDDMLHAVTGLSGSGPAYGFMIIEALADGGVAMGLPRKMSLQLAAQTLLGAAKMVLETGDHPGELKDRVASPAGTTMAAIEKLEQYSVRSAMIEAVRAATTRSRELGGN